MRSITYRKLFDCISDGKMTIKEGDYSYDEIIRSIPRIKLIKKLYNIEIVILELEDRKINSLNDILLVFNIKDKKKRLNFIYDKMCDYLDLDFVVNNKCLFKNNKCVSDRNKSYNKNCGCCRAKSGELCKFLINNRCSIRNLGCKFFICPTLKKRGLKYRNRDFPIFNYFCSFREKIVLRYTIFVPKEKVIERCLSHRW